MLTQYLKNPQAKGVAVHNTAHWQVTSMMGGLACEILKKERGIDEKSRRRNGLSLHDCYPGIFMQGDEAADFLAELEKAQEKFTSQEIDRLILEEYSESLSYPKYRGGFGHE